MYTEKFRNTVHTFERKNIKGTKHGLNQKKQKTLPVDGRKNIFQKRRKGQHVRYTP
jgi:hypothetical protein